MIERVNTTSRFLLVVNCLLLFFSFVSFANTASISKTPTSSGLVGYWTFDQADVTDKIYDRSGRGNHGYFIGGTTATSTAHVVGRLGKAMNFDGSDDYVNVADGVPLRVEQFPFTVSVWIYPTIIRQQMILFKSVTNFSGSGYGLVMNRTGDDINLVKMGVIDQDVSYTFSANRWYHVVAKQNVSSVEYFINGVSIGSFSNASAYQSSSGQGLYVGGGNSFMNQFAGLIDDVRIYNRALSYAEIQQLYNSQKGSGVAKTPTSSGLVGYWTFDAADVTDKIYDRSGKGAHGYLTTSVATSSVKITGKIGQALQFDDTSYYFSFNPASFPSGGAPRTTSMWVKTTYGGGGDLYFFGYGNGATNQDWALGVMSSGRFVFTQNGASFLSSFAINDDKWHHIVATHEGGGLVKMYVDGAFNGSGSFTLATGLNSGSVGSSLTSSVDDVRVYNRALSATEIAQLYNSQKSSKVEKIAPSSGLVGYWTFDVQDVTDKIYDRSGRGNHGYFYNDATTTAHIVGKLGKAFSFDGSNDYMAVSDSDNLDLTSAITVSGWIYRNTNAISIVATKRLGGGWNYQCWTESDNKLYFNFSGAANVSSNSTLPLNQWTHVACTFNDAVDEVKLYINGALDKTTTIAVTPTTNTGFLFVARDGDTGSNYANAKIDDVRVYSRALSASEVLQLYNSR